MEKDMHNPEEKQFRFGASEALEEIIKKLNRIEAAIFCYYCKHSLAEHRRNQGCTHFLGGESHEYCPCRVSYDNEE